MDDLDGATGELWPMDRYIANLKANPQPTIHIDQVRVHVHGDTAVVSARSSTRPGQFNCYVDTSARRGDRWLCVHASVWPSTPGALTPAAAAGPDPDATP